MINTFRYALTLEDYIKFYKFQYKRANIISFVFACGFMVMIALYDYFVLKNIILPLCIIVGMVISAAYMLYHYNVVIKRNAMKLVKNSDAYLKQCELTVDASAIKSNNLPEMNEAGIIGVYPYSIMNAIYETEEYFYFIIGTEAKILPKGAIPQEMKESVIRLIKQNQNCVFIK